MNTTSKYTLDPRVVRAIDETEEFIGRTGRKYSDIEDQNGMQYVDLVQEGGGILGIGLIGYTYALEELGFRFYSHSGTSAGSINAVLLSAIGKPHEKKAIKILEILESLELMNFVDGGDDAKNLVRKISKNATRTELFLTALNQLDDFFLRKSKGINRGEAFYEWISSKLADCGIFQMKDLKSRMNDFLALKYLGRPMEPEDAELAIVTSDITTQTKAVFPKLSKLYFSKPDEVNPAFFVRASMSIPVFFDPVELDLIPKTKENIREWQRNIESAYFGKIPDQVMLVDGGVLSNFPIDIFHVNNGVPKKPTFGVKLGYDRVNPRTNNSILEIIYNSFSAARQIRDFEVISKNRDYVNLIAPIDDSGINWLDFNISDEKKILLFVRGVQAACTFLQKFDWNNYKPLRQVLHSEESNEAFKVNQQQFLANFIRKAE